MLQENYHETSRLYLRLYQDIDFNSFLVLLTNPQLGSYMGAKPFLKQPDLVKNFLYQMGKKNKKDKLWLLYSIFYKESLELIGGCGFKINLDDESAEIFYLLCPEQWGKGLMAEACRKIINQVSKQLVFKKIYALILPENTRAQKVALKLTFKNSKTFILRRYGQEELAQQWVY